MTEQQASEIITLLTSIDENVEVIAFAVVIVGVLWFLGFHSS